MSINEIQERVEESKRLNGVFGPQAQDDLEYLLGMNAELLEVLEACKELLDSEDAKCPLDVPLKSERRKEWGIWLNRVSVARLRLKEAIAKAEGKS